MKIATLPITILTIMFLFFTNELFSEEELKPWQKAKKTELWKPVPPVVTSMPGKAPSDAIILFDGKNLEQWQSAKGGPARWSVSSEMFTVKAGEGDIKTKREFCDVQLHIEWKAPEKTEGLQGQGRGNSGVFFQERYEVQVLDSFENLTYSNGQAASVYKQHIPLVNAMRSPQHWNVYDIVFEAPKFTESGALEKAAIITVFHNGVLVQNHVELAGPTAWIGHPKYEKHACAPISLQDHANPVSYRNIWVREL